MKKEEMTLEKIVKSLLADLENTVNDHAGVMHHITYYRLTEIVNKYKKILNKYETL